MPRSACRALHHAVQPPGELGDRVARVEQGDIEERRERRQGLDRRADRLVEHETVRALLVVVQQQHDAAAKDVAAGAWGRHEESPGQEVHASIVRMRRTHMPPTAFGTDSLEYRTYSPGASTRRMAVLPSGR